MNGKLDNKAQLALLKEILCDDEQLKNLINKSDSTLKLVKNFFNDDEDDARSISSNNMVCGKKHKNRIREISEWVVKLKRLIWRVESNHLNYFTRHFLFR